MQVPGGVPRWLEGGYPVGANLPDAIWSLARVPVFGFPFGIFGAATLARGRGRRVGSAAAMRR